jgi:hypothetical protein
MMRLILVLLRSGGPPPVPARRWTTLTNACFPEGG